MTEELKNELEQANIRVIARYKSLYIDSLFENTEQSFKEKVHPLFLEELSHCSRELLEEYVAECCDRIAYNAILPYIELLKLVKA